MPPSDTTRPPRRRDRPTQPALTRQGIIDVAIKIMRDEGLTKVTMRRIAAALDTGPASLYVHVRNTEDLHAQILDALLGSVTTPDAGSGSWRERLKILLMGYTRVLFDHPEIARMAMSTQPSGPHYLALVDAILALLHAGGITDHAAAWGVDLVLLFATAVATEQSTRQAAPQGDDRISTIATALATADPAHYPQVVRLGGLLLAGAGPDRFDWALDVLLDGMRSNPRTPLA